jgi:hypothetical protein
MVHSDTKLPASLPERSFRPFLVSAALCLLCLTASSAGQSARQGVIRSELQPYADARTVVDQTPTELLENFPELAKALSFTDSQSELPALLQRVGDNVADFFRYFPNTASTEEVRQEVLGTDGRVLASGRTRYNYLMLASEGRGIGLDEYRSDSQGQEVKPRGSGSFMLSYLCAWHLVHFHPLHQAESRFRLLGAASKPQAYVIAFAQRPEAARHVGQFDVEDPDWMGRDVFILVQGVVWVDPQSYQIVRAHTELLAPRYDVGLARDTTQIECAETRFPGIERSFWLPREAIVTSVFRNITYRNRHRYSDYRLFSVETRDKVNPPVPP